MGSGSESTRKYLAQFFCLMIELRRPGMLLIRKTDSLKGGIWRDIASLAAGPEEQ
jgi:hypothetical protein